MQGMEIGNMIIKKRFGKRIVQYSGSNDDYALVPKKRKKQIDIHPRSQRDLPQRSGSQAELEAQQAANAVRFIPQQVRGSAGVQVHGQSHTTRGAFVRQIGIRSSEARTKGDGQHGTSSVQIHETIRSAEILL
jgi:hypothetical protein